ncbi:MAG TPA: UxaA family hydrolase, partial [Chitinophagaceae bacterium]|nr:UxaA family hydrolase [Chitinophagaceae bacterium]
MKQRVLKVHPKDNVLVALTNLSKGETISFEGAEYILTETIPAKHKFFMREMNPGDEIIMYGVLVGKVQTRISKTSRMTTENSKHAAEPYAYRNARFEWQAPDVSKFKNRTF